MPSYSFRADVELPEVEVRWFRVQERLSAPSVIDVQLALAGPLRATSLLGRNARLDVRGVSPRAFVGAITHADQFGDADAPGLRLTIESPIALLRYNRRSAVFQHQTTRAIVEAVFERNNLRARANVEWRLSRALAPRDYCAQYRETDLQFVARLLEHEGIFYFADDDASRDDLTSRIVVTDDASTCRPMAGDPTLPLRPRSAMDRSEESVHLMTTQHRMRPASVTLGDFNPRRPLHRLHAQASSTDDPRPGEGEYHEHPAAFVDHELAGRLASVRAEELDATRVVHSLAGDSPRVQPGTTLNITGAPDASGGSILCTSATHTGLANADGRGAYEVAFDAIPSDTPYRPARTTAAPRSFGVCTATVVGPEGQEVHTDAMGRIKVRFHWDREGAREGDTSCWIRVAQAWAGAGYGASFTPRVGMEVVVAFLEGDPDRPIVLGCVPNAVNPTPHALPANKTRSTIRTQSTPGGAGYNEILFEDKAGSELLALHAALDARTEVARDRRAVVGRSDVVQAETITFTTGEASLTLDGANVTISARGTIAIEGRPVLVNGAPPQTGSTAPPATNADAA